MRARLLYFLCSICFVLVQTKGENLHKSISLRLEGYATNIARFNRHFPQEKVYLHMDNRSYFIGDTLFSKHT